MRRGTIGTDVSIPPILIWRRDSSRGDEQPELVADKAWLAGFRGEYFYWRRCYPASILRTNKHVARDKPDTQECSRSCRCQSNKESDDP